MKHTKRILSYIMALSIVCSMAVPTVAEENDSALPAETEAAVTELDDTSSEADTAEIEEYAATNDNDVLIAGWKQHNTDPLCDGFHYQEKADGTIMITGSDKTNPNIVIPTKLKGKAVTEIGDQAFYRYEEIESVYVPSSVKKINFSAFAKCTNLKSITISGVKEIEHAICYDDTSLTEVNLEGNIESIGPLCFVNTAADKIYVPKTVSEIGFYAFGYETFYWDPEEDGNLVEDYRRKDNFTLECDAGSKAYYYAVKSHVNYAFRDNFKVGSTKITSAKMVGSNSLKLTWKKSKNATGYKIKVWGPNDEKFVTYKYVKGGDNTGVVIKNIKKDGMTRIRIKPLFKDEYVKVFGEDCESLYYNKITPSELIGASSTSNSAIIRYEINSKEIEYRSGVRIEMYDYKAKKWVKYLHVKGNESSKLFFYKNGNEYIKLKNLKPNTRYKFRIRYFYKYSDSRPDVFGKTTLYSPWSNSKVITTKM